MIYPQGGFKEIEVGVRNFTFQFPIAFSSFLAYAAACEATKVSTRMNVVPMAWNLTESTLESAFFVENAEDATALGAAIFAIGY